MLLASLLPLASIGSVQPPQFDESAASLYWGALPPVNKACKKLRQILFLRTQPLTPALLRRATRRLHPLHEQDRRVLRRDRHRVQQCRQRRRVLLQVPGASCHVVTLTLPSQFWHRLGTALVRNRPGATAQALATCKNFNFRSSDAGCTLYSDGVLWHLESVLAFSLELAITCTLSVHFFAHNTQVVVTHSTHYCTASDWNQGRDKLRLLWLPDASAPAAGSAPDEAR